MKSPAEEALFDENTLEALTSACMQSLLQKRKRHSI